MTTMTTNLEILRDRTGSELARRLPGQLERLHWPADRLARHQRDQLRVLLRHAVERSPFHARRLSQIDPGRFELSDLGRLPTMTKSVMMAAFDDVVTDRRLSLARIEDHLAKSSAEPSLLLEEYVCLASGGSSGQRGVFVQRLGEFADLATSIMRSARARQLTGGSPGAGMVIGAVMAASPVHASGFGVATLSGPVQFVSVPATLAIAEAVNRLNALQPPAIMGYSTKLAQLAREQLAGRLAIEPRSVTATSEQLTSSDRSTITAAFGVPVVNTFASTEGLVGHSDPGGSVLTFATDMCVVELVDAANGPVLAGAASSKILVTNLYNLTQPLIRYELSDRFIRYPALPGSGYLRAEVKGREDEVFQYGSVEIHPLAIATVMDTTANVIEYQAYQTEHGIDVAIVADGPFDTIGISNAVRDSLSGAGLVNPTVSVREVSVLPRHPQTGKVRRFIRLPR